MANRPNYTHDRKLLLLIYFGLYYMVLLGFFIDDRLLFEYRPIFFNYNRDLTELGLIATGLPRWMIAHPTSFPVADLLAFLVPLPVIWQNLRIPSFSPWPGILFFIFIALLLFAGRYLLAGASRALYPLLSCSRSLGRRHALTGSTGS